jgi:hypothetical protein
MSNASQGKRYSLPLSFREKMMEYTARMTPMTGSKMDMKTAPIPKLELHSIRKFLALGD